MWYCVFAEKLLLHIFRLNLYFSWNFPVFHSTAAKAAYAAVSKLLYWFDKAAALKFVRHILPQSGICRQSAFGIRLINYLGGKASGCAAGLKQTITNGRFFRGLLGSALRTSGSMRADLSLEKGTTVQRLLGIYKQLLYLMVMLCVCWGDVFVSYWLSVVLC